MTSVGIPSRRSVPGVFPDSFDSLAISITSSANWKTMPIFSPKRVRASTSCVLAPESNPPNLADVAIKEPVLSAITLR